MRRAVAKLDNLWREFHFITDDPHRQYASFLWFDRTDSTFMRGAEFDFARAEDKGAASDEMIRRLAVVFRAKAERAGGSNVAASKPIDDYFRDISAFRSGPGRAATGSRPSTYAPPGLANPRRASLSTVALDRRAAKAIVGVLSRPPRSKTSLMVTRDAIRDSVVGILMSPHFCYRADAARRGGRAVHSAACSGYGLASCPELSPLVEPSRRGVAGPRRLRGRT